MKTATCVWILALSVALASCGSAAPQVPSVETTQRLLAAAFPGAEITVREVQQADGRLRVPAVLNGADVLFVLQPQGGDWQLAYVEQAGQTYTVEEIRRTAATVRIMRSVSAALEAYRGTQGQYPMLDDQVGLGDLVPDYFQGEHPILDAWNVPLRYRFEGKEYTLTSSGPDGTPGTPDDIILVTGDFVQTR